jgi:hypothetical protein
VALAQLDAVPLGLADEQIERPQTKPGVGRMGDGLGLHRGIDGHPLEARGLDRAADQP